MSHEYSEDELIEQPTIDLFRKLDWKARNCLFENLGEEDSTLGRKTTQEVVLISQLRTALKRLNKELPDEAIEQAIEQLTIDRSAVSPVEANREIYKLLKDGVKVTITTDEGDQPEIVKVIDWNNPKNNDFFLASQLWISGDIYKRRTDLLGFVNGLPLVFIELKASHRRLETAYKNNLRDYKSAIPQLFWYNALIILSNGTDSRIGSVSAPWEHFSEWKKISSEEEEGIVSLETMIRGTCEQSRLLDLVENFTLFSDIRGGLIKIIAKNHQFLGVNNALSAVHKLGDNSGKLGVFWHTQGSGKSFSMIFFGQKVLRKVPGNWTFVVVTDREDLDDQIYKTFASTGAVTEGETAVRAQSGESLKQLLREDHRYVFTMIHKFRTERGETYPQLTDRSDVIVMTDEAHRTQYDVLARNMRNAIPKAAFIGFTGTPLMAGEEKTKEVFGDYVSVYDFKQSIDDKATVPLYYENRIPELQLTNENLNEEMEELLEEALVDEAQEQKLEKEFSREYHLIIREDRLEKIAEDIVAHFTGRGYGGKAMVVCVDKATAVRMYDKVQRHWQSRIGSLRKQLKAADSLEKEQLEKEIKSMEETDMAVVVSQGQNEAEDMKKKGLDIVRHRKRMLKETLDEKFKNPSDPLRIVFVCAMWMTGFDVPSCSTIYLDKPMRNHTLMQTIARANRVFGDKVNGLIVDYIGVFRNLQKALAIYAGGGHKATEGEMPVQDKSALVETLGLAIQKVEQFCHERSADLADILSAKKFDKLRLLDDAVELIMVNDESKRRYMSMAADVVRLHKAILPDASADEFTPMRAVVSIIAEKIRSVTPDPDITEIVGRVDELLDKSVAAEQYIIHAALVSQEHLIDLGKIDFEALKKRFAHGRKRTETERLRASIERKLRRMVQLNKSRTDYLEKFQAMIDDYNSGAANVEKLFKELLDFAQDLNDEEKRAIGENLSEEELAILDLLTRPDLKLTKKEESDVKRVAKELLSNLKNEKLVLDWRKRQQTRSQVKVAIEEALDKGLPDKFTPEIFEAKCQIIYQHVYDSYYGEGRSVYAT